MLVFKCVAVWHVCIRDSILSCVTWRIVMCDMPHCNSLQHCNTLQLKPVMKVLNTNFTAAHCESLQHTATHCNTLQHTATHCNTNRQERRGHAQGFQEQSYCNALQRTATQCNLTATHCNFAATHCNTHRSRRRSHGGVLSANFTATHSNTL